MPLFKDTNGKLRLGYFEKMCQAEEAYNRHMAVLEAARKNIKSYRPGTDEFGNLARMIEDRKAFARQAQDEMNMYSSALTAVCTALMTK